MRRLRIVHFIRTTLFLVVLTVILGAVGTLLWANYTGMPKSWRQAVERGIEKHGIYVEIGGLSFNPLEGIVARQVKVYANAERKQVISLLEGIILDLDNSKLAKGEIQLAKVKLSKARLVLPVNPGDPDSEMLEIDNIHGEFIPPGNPHIEVRNARGTIAGIEVILNAKIADDLPPASDLGEGPERAGQRDFVARIVNELQEWSFDKQSPPQVRIQFVGKRSEMSQAKATIGFHARSVKKNQHTIDEVKGEAELHGNLLVVRSIEATSGNRRLSARMDYEMDRQFGRFNLDSSLEAPELLQSWFGMKPIKELLIAGEQRIQASGEFQLVAGKTPNVHATGHARCESAMLRGIRFDQMESAFAWRDGDLFLKDLLLTRTDGEIKGKALIQPDMVRMDLHSTLLPEFYRPMFAGKATERIINDFKAGPKSSMELRLEGGFDRSDPRSWAFAGKSSLRDIAYRGVDLASVDTNLSMSSSQMDFTNGSITFDYSNYPMAKRFGGPDQGRLSFESLRYRRGDNRQVSFSGLEGAFWPAPVCRLFMDATADKLESYGFHHPPFISGSGTYDVENRKATRINLDFNSEHQAQYVFLKAPVTLSKPSGKVSITDRGVTVDDLKLTAFEGPIQIRIDYLREQPMSIEFEASSLSMDAINSTYGMNMECGGQLSGKASIRMMPGQVATMEGEGSMTLEKSELFSVPIFGPLSILLQTILGDKRVGAERAKDASCSFRIEDGIVASNDFHTTTTSLVFAGEGWVDLNQKTMDMTMRLNARGFLGLITLPFRPLYGLFQFRGTGPTKKPEWQRVMFTKPNDRVQEMLLKAPELKAGQP